MNIRDQLKKLSGEDLKHLGEDCGFEFDEVRKNQFWIEYIVQTIESDQELIDIAFDHYGIEIV